MSDPRTCPWCQRPIATVPVPSMSGVLVCAICAYNDIVRWDDEKRAAVKK